MDALALVRVSIHSNVGHTWRWLTRARRRGAAPAAGSRRSSLWNGRERRSCCAWRGSTLGYTQVSIWTSALSSPDDRATRCSRGTLATSSTCGCGGALHILFFYMYTHRLRIRGPRDINERGRRRNVPGSRDEINFKRNKKKAVRPKSCSLTREDSTRTRSPP